MSHPNLNSTNGPHGCFIRIVVTAPPHLTFPDSFSLLCAPRVPHGSPPWTLQALSWALWAPTKRDHQEGICLVRPVHPLFPVPRSRALHVVGTQPHTAICRCGNRKTEKVILAYLRWQDTLFGFLFPFLPSIDREEVCHPFAPYIVTLTLEAWEELG